MIGSHTIPAFYLKQFSFKFAGKKQDFIWVYEKGKNPALRNIRKQGKERGYFAARQDGGLFDDAAPEGAMARLEDESNEVLACCRSELFDWSSTAHRKKLAFYASFMYMRSTQRRSHSEFVGKRVHSELASEANDSTLMKEIADAINTAAGKHVFTPESARSFVLEFVQNANTQEEMNTHFVSGLRGLAEHFSELLLQKIWQVWRSPCGIEFITSDNPVINFIPLANGPLFPGQGFNKGQTAFPLAPDACLVMGVPPGAPWSLGVDKVTVDRVNEAVISICDRYVYSKTCSSNIQESVQHYAGSFKYGQNALLPIGMRLPRVRDFLRKQFRLPAENASP